MEKRVERYTRADTVNNVRGVLQKVGNRHPDAGWYRTQGLGGRATHRLLLWLPSQILAGRDRCRLKRSAPRRLAVVIRACGVSDAGRVRKTNEDSFVSDPETRFFAVADGMGGHNAGEVASSMAIDTATSFIRRSAGGSDFSWPYGLDKALSFDGNRLRTAIYLANRRVLRAAESSDAYGGMGTTIVALLVNGSQIAIGHVGDSRLYLLSGGAIQQLTSDDSWAATVLAQDPSLTPEEIAKHPMRHVLTNVLGAREPLEVHLSERKFADGEAVLLCSDGLHGALDDAAILEIMQSTPDVEEAAQTLVKTAMDRGSRDNVTALIVRYEADK
jgi:serine/threonine protein phosphatase PrpC